MSHVNASTDPYMSSRIHQQKHCFRSSAHGLEEVKQLDIAMFQLDPRLGKDFLRGGEQFINKIKTANLLPLHFGDNYQLIKQFKPIAEAANCKLLPLEHTGQSFKIK